MNSEIKIDKVTLAEALRWISDEIGSGEKCIPILHEKAIYTLVEFFRHNTGFCIHNGDMYILQDKHTKVEDKDGNIAFVGFKKHEI